MAEIVKKDYIEYNKELLLGQYQGKENINNLLEVTGFYINEIQDAIIELRNLFWLDTAMGVQLDIIGRILKVFSRISEDDDIFRAYIREQASIFISGTPDEIIRSLIATFFATYVHYMNMNDQQTAAYGLYTDASVSQTELERISPAGVKPYFLGGIAVASGEFLGTFDNKIIVHCNGRS